MPMLTAPSTIVSSPLLPTSTDFEMRKGIESHRLAQKRLGAAFGASFIWPASLIYFSRSRSPSKRRKVMKKLQNKTCPIKQHVRWFQLSTSFWSFSFGSLSESHLIGSGTDSIGIHPWPYAEPDQQPTRDIALFGFVGSLTIMS
ncbi:uncharacterized protein LOC117618834 isoform X2 [Prunus dulcis]|uniref:uncharacterized protein LOC117618834 isoform X2 n=1 Tax=Prunus dulcis TaxID=3755 RepID=UPI001482981E|nr:uncharacterized protein LOC117618834 isoform X2 [Prunus dulcis]XP_034204468.1 uncharacterized protein LOC117618834 isoform X2 [Prunus dulcis]